MKFYGLGMNDLQNGSYGGSVVVNADQTKAEHKGRGGFTGRAEDMFKFKVPQLYNLKDSPFYGHGASFSTLEEVVAYKNAGVPQKNSVPRTQLAAEFKPLNLTNDEQRQLVTFLRNSLHDPELKRYVPTSLPSGAAFPNNDPEEPNRFRLLVGCCICVDCHMAARRHQAQRLLLQRVNATKKLHFSEMELLFVTLVT